MRTIDTDIPDVKIISTDVYSDNRGFFLESYHNEKYNDVIAECFCQDNISSSKQSVVRGLHYQVIRPQGKLVQCLKGMIFDVAVDIRKDSPTFKKWVGVILSERNKQQLWIPEGFAHGFMSLEDDSIVYYKCTDVYIPEYDRNIRWNDPDIDIKYPNHFDDVIISDKDNNAPFLKDIKAYDLY